MATDNPGVRVPPPLYYALALLCGFLLNRRWPLPIAGGAVLIAAATVLLVGSLALIVSSFATFRRSGTTVVPIRPANTLVIAGPYLLTRNPMYVGMAVLTIALALFMGTWWPILLLVPVLVVVQQSVIKSEEAYLTRRFGADYSAYMKRVRRWI